MINHNYQYLNVLLSLDLFSNSKQQPFLWLFFPIRCSEQRGCDICFNILLRLSDIPTSDIVSLVNSEVSCWKQFAQKSSPHLNWLCLVGPAHLSLVSFPALIQAALILFTSGK
ncbi:hypothetical protein AMECASPLE_010786 [Ameca splendens]|uniref:Uncharacterized protein n=1 Tax=Ameca splendens TaxID=208324 RepID=A0ABV0YMN5_9TELE